MSSNFNSSSVQQPSSFNQSRSNTYTSSTQQPSQHVEQVLLPTQVIEKPVAIHEEIRKELVEEVQPVINVEKIHTEVHQVTQPLFDKEVRAVHIENKTLAPQYLEEVRTESRGVRSAEDYSTTRFVDTKSMVVEKPAMYNEIEKKQVIEEIQPVIYKETIVPTVIQETKPMYQKVVEGTVFTQETMATRGIRSEEEMRLEAQRNSYQPSNTVVAPVRQNVLLPTQVIEKPAAVHEDIRRETIEEITPVWNVEKIKTEVHQITAPLFDKEVKPVIIEKKVLNTEILPEVNIQGRGVRAVEDHNTTQYLDTKTTLVEKPAIYNEVERTQVIEEIQPVIYKETVVPTVIRETKPVFQKIVEGTVYTHETLAPRSLHDTNYHYSSQTDRDMSFQQPQQFQQPLVQPIQQSFIPVEQPLVQPVQLPIREVIIEQTSAPVLSQPLQHVREVIDETTTTTTTTSAPLILGETTARKSHGGIFHRHRDAPAHNTGMTGTTGMTGARDVQHQEWREPGPHGNVQHIHDERVLPGGQKIVEDTTRSHSETVLPSRLI